MQFCALLDRDGPGNNAAKKLREDMSVNVDCILQITDGIAIEDLFTGEDFGKLLKSYDSDLTVDTSSTPSKIMNKLNIDKVLLSRHFSGAVNTSGFVIDQLSEKTRARVKSLFAQIIESLSKQPI
jgi:hypothetical protein